MTNLALPATRIANVPAERLLGNLSGSTDFAAPITKAELAAWLELDTALQPADITSGTITAGTGDINFDSLGLANATDITGGVLVHDGDGSTPGTLEAGVIKPPTGEEFQLKDHAGIQVLKTSTSDVVFIGRTTGQNRLMATFWPNTGIGISLGKWNRRFETVYTRVVDSYDIPLKLGPVEEGVVIPGLDIDDSNYERGFMRWENDVFTIGTEAAGTGTSRKLHLISDEGPLYLTTPGSTAVLYLGSTGNTIGTWGGRISFGASTNLGAGIGCSIAGDRNGDLELSTTSSTPGTGINIGLETTEPVGFYGTSPVQQATTSIAEASFVENAGGTPVNDDSTFNGYTMQQITQALQDIGILA